MGNKNFIRNNRDLSIVLIVYSILAIFILKFYHFNLGADGISYISIALKYTTGDWVNAFNGVWSPLYSWLMTPIMLMGYNTSYATYITRIVSLVIGFFTIIGISRLSSIFELDHTIKRAVLVTSIPMVLFFAIIYDTPDLLVACLLTYYFSIIFKPDYSDKLTNGTLCGFIGAMAFLSKSYIFPFFLVHFILFNLIYYFKGGKLKKANIKKSLFFGLMVFMLISGIWIGTISEKYDKLTIGTANEYNHAVIGPDYPDHPVYIMGLIKPPYQTATSTWDDPYLVKMKDWSPFESWQNFDYQLNIIAENLYRTIIMFEYYSLLSLAIIIISLYLIFRSDTPKFVKKNLSYLLISIGIYAGGYCLIMVQERFLWPIIILLMICGFYLIKVLYENKNISIKVRNMFIIVLMFSFIFNPAYELINYPHTDNGTYDLSKTLQNNYGVHGNIASNGNWENTLQIAYYLNSQFYGLPKNIDNSSQLENELLANNISYYFVWGDSNNLTLLNYKEITNGKIQGLKIYAWNNRQI